MHSVEVGATVKLPQSWARVHSAPGESWPRPSHVRCPNLPYCTHSVSSTEAEPYMHLLSVALMPNCGALVTSSDALSMRTGLSVRKVCSAKLPWSPWSSIPVPWLTHQWELATRPDTPTYPQPTEKQTFCHKACPAAVTTDTVARRYPWGHRGVVQMSCSQLPPQFLGAHRSESTYTLGLTEKRALYVTEPSKSPYSRISEPSLAME
mmetsp:Transcript_15834/g.36638  ORF Transcript_15834/g.36638 Transcript_15834/m.36638 type:complete len:207 (-) Transcript_15834:481-1101(-)